MNEYLKIRKDVPPRMSSKGVALYPTECIKDFVVSGNTISAGSKGGYINPAVKYNSGFMWIDEDSVIEGILDLNGDFLLWNTTQIIGDLSIDNAGGKSCVKFEHVIVEDNANVSVAGDVYAFDCHLFNNTQLLGNEDVGITVESSKLTDNAMITDTAQVFNSVLSDDASVTDSANVTKSTLKDSARVCNNVKLVACTVLENTILQDSVDAMSCKFYGDNKLGGSLNCRMGNISDCVYSGSGQLTGFINSTENLQRILGIVSDFDKSGKVNPIIAARDKHKNTIRTASKKSLSLDVCKDLVLYPNAKVESIEDYILYSTNFLKCKCYSDFECLLADCVAFNIHDAKHLPGDIMPDRNFELLPLKSYYDIKNVWLYHRTHALPFYLTDQKYWNGVVYVSDYGLIDFKPNGYDNIEGYNLSLYDTYTTLIPSVEVRRYTIHSAYTREDMFGYTENTNAIFGVEYEDTLNTGACIPDLESYALEFYDKSKRNTVDVSSTSVEDLAPTVDSVAACATITEDVTSIVNSIGCAYDVPEEDNSMFAVTSEEEATITQVNKDNLFSDSLDFSSSTYDQAVTKLPLRTRLTQTFASLFDATCYLDDNNNVTGIGSEGASIKEFFEQERDAFLDQIESLVAENAEEFDDITLRDVCETIVKSFKEGLIEAARAV